jgi:CubicO group peptidase (beta-lactamase class C family)
LNAARPILLRAIDARIFPAAVAEVGDRSGVRWREAFGTLAFDDARATVDTTIFDLASLTKPIATTSIVIDLVARGQLQMGAPLTTLFADWRGADRDSVTVQDLLEHASGLAARLMDSPSTTRRELEHDICALPLEYPPRTKSIYSDLGFILLAFLAADAGGQPFEALFDRVNARVPRRASDQLLAFGVATGDRERTAPTQPLAEDLRRGRRLVGEVHDNYAAALGGVAGHAGLFGNAAGVGSFARAVLAGALGDESLPSPFSPALVMQATRRSDVPGSSRALGWDTMLPTSSCGTRMSQDAFGHVGFTGTSLWIDPRRDRYFVLLTNRVCGGGTEADIKDVRRSFHDALGDV